MGLALCPNRARADALGLGRTVGPVNSHRKWRPMKTKTLGPFVALLLALALCACATTPASTGVSAEPTYVAAVEVVQSDGAIPDGFADALRTVVLDEAAFYGTSGRALTMRIDLRRVHFKNVVQALIIGDNNDARGQVTVIDASSSQ